jgi:hypothetical protein
MSWIVERMLTRMLSMMVARDQHAPRPAARRGVPSGWLTLSRGMQDLPLLERGWRIAALRILRFPVINEQTGPCPYTENVSDEYSSIGDV